MSSKISPKIQTLSFWPKEKITKLPSLSSSIIKKLEKQYLLEAEEELKKKKKDPRFSKTFENKKKKKEVSSATANSTLAETAVNGNRIYNKETNLNDDSEVDQKKVKSSKPLKQSVDNESKLAVPIRPDLLKKGSNLDLFRYLFEQSFFSYSQSKQLNLDWSKLFKETYDQHEKWLAGFHKKYFSTTAPRYTTFLVTYENAINYETPIREFSQFTYEGVFYFINYLNESFSEPLLKAWNSQKHARAKERNTYFGTALSGSSQSGRFQQKKNLLSLLPPNLSFKFEKLLKTWNGYSLFPIQYIEGERGYGRLKSLPTSTLSNVKQEIKQVVLNFIKDQTGLRFVEIDLKSCHTVIFKSLVDLGPTETKALPSIETHWPDMINQFKKVRKDISETLPIKEISKEWVRLVKESLKVVNSWDDNQIKGLCKNQWYKALNGGSCFVPHDSLKRSQNKLGISDQLMPFVQQFVEVIFKDVSVLNILSQFQKQINSHTQIYLPSRTLPFLTSTLSKKQVATAKSFESVQDLTNESDLISPITDKRQTRMQYGMTGMSRVFSSCEIVLVLMAVVSLRGTGLLPISYEADGLLLVSRLSDDELVNALNIINQDFKNLAKRFLKEEFSLELKNKVM